MGAGQRGLVTETSGENKFENGSRLIGRDDAIFQATTAARSVLTSSREPWTRVSD